MKEQDDKLTLQDTEQLCRLYMDCKLSVFEETELRYFLTQVDFHSPLIDEVRRIMDIDVYIADKSFVKADSYKKHVSRKWLVPISIAASIAIIFSIGLISYQNSSIVHNSEQSYYIAYADGHRLSDEAAKLRIEAEKIFADDFIKEMSELEAREQHMIDNFLTANILEQ